MNPKLRRHTRLQARNQAFQKPHTKSKLPALLVAGVSTILVIGIIVFLDPQSFLAPVLLFCFVFTSAFFSLSLVINNNFKSAIYATALLLFLVLRYFGIGHFLNLILIIGIVISIEIFMSSR